MSAAGKPVPDGLEPWTLACRYNVDRAVPSHRSDNYVSPYPYMLTFYTGRMTVRVGNQAATAAAVIVRDRTMLLEKTSFRHAEESMQAGVISFSIRWSPRNSRPFFTPRVAKPFRALAVAQAEDFEAEVID